MINKNFYPTPYELIEKMIKGVKWERITTILEPSAGKGDIVEHITRENSWNKRKLDIDTIELDEDLRATLKGKGIRVVHDNFLTYYTHKRYDLIVMNPPFDNGDKHLLKAIDLQKNGGAIICLLNAETLKNTYSNTRKELARKLEELNATIEYMENSFMSAERRTNVEIALIKISVESKEQEEILFNNLKKEESFINYEEKEEQAVSKYSINEFVEMVVEQYNTELKLGISLIKEYFTLSKYSLNNENTLTLITDKEHYNKYDKQEEQKTLINGFISKTREKYWKSLFSNDKFIGQLTSKIRDEFLNQVKELSNYDFSIFNIVEIQQDIKRRTMKSVEDEILYMFEEFSDKYSWFNESSKNIHYYNGWKTNKSWKIGKKVIIPLQAFDSFWGNFSWQFRDKVKDIIKVFNYLANRKSDEIDTEQIFKEAEKAKQTSKVDFDYFYITFYKKGTTHIEFKDEELLKKFNIFGSQKKGWLPPNYAKKQYNDMTQEEQEVINEFDGSKEEYEKVLLRQDYYLTTTQLLLN